MDLAQCAASRGKMSIFSSIEKIPKFIGDAL